MFIIGDDYLSILMSVWHAETGGNLELACASVTVGVTSQFGSYLFPEALGS